MWFPRKLAETGAFLGRDFAKPSGSQLTEGRAAPRAMCAPMPTSPGRGTEGKIPPLPHQPRLRPAPLACCRGFGVPVKIQRFWGLSVTPGCGGSSHSAARHTCWRKETLKARRWKLHGAIQWVAAFLQRAIKIPFGNAIASLPSCITLLFQGGPSSTLKRRRKGPGSAEP